MKEADGTRELVNPSDNSVLRSTCRGKAASLQFVKTLRDKILTNSLANVAGRGEAGLSVITRLTMTEPLNVWPSRRVEQFWDATFRVSPVSGINPSTAKYLRIMEPGSPKNMEQRPAAVALSAWSISKSALLM